MVFVHAYAKLAKAQMALGLNGSSTARISVFIERTLQNTRFFSRASLTNGGLVGYIGPK